MSDATIFITIAFAAVWMQRKKRWTYFFKALEGSAVLGSSGAASISNSPVGGGTGVADNTQQSTNTATGQPQTTPTTKQQ